MTPASALQFVVTLLSELAQHGAMISLAHMRGRDCRLSPLAGAYQSDVRLWAKCHRSGMANLGAERT